MNRPVKLKTRPQLALESYLDALLQDATEEALPEPILVLEPAVEAESTLDEFQLAVLDGSSEMLSLLVGSNSCPGKSLGTLPLCRNRS